MADGWGGSWLGWLGWLLAGVAPGWVGCWLGWLAVLVPSHGLSSRTGRAPLPRSRRGAVCILLQVALFLGEFAFKGTIHMLSVFHPYRKSASCGRRPSAEKKAGPRFLIMICKRGESERSINFKRAIRTAEGCSNLRPLKEVNGDPRLTFFWAFRRLPHEADFL